MRRLTVISGSRSAVPIGAAPPAPTDWGRNGLPPLVDADRRRYTYLRLSVTDRCDMACVYCMPPSGEEDHALRPDMLTFEESARVVDVFASMGVRTVRFTGGEPLVRRDVVALVEMVHDRTGIDDLAITTNAARLPELAWPLRRAGLARVNVSLDSLDPDRFRALTRGGDLSRVLAGIRAAQQAGFSEIKLNVVPLRGHNDDEVVQIVEWAWSEGLVPRFIELMPLGEGANLPPSLRVTADEVAGLLADRLDRSAGHEIVAGRGPAGYVPSRDGRHRVGFITALTDVFCESCNRMRVTSRGEIRACLASRRSVSLRDAMRAGASDRELAWLVHWALGDKADGHRFLDAAVDEHAHVGMSLIGG